ncbi:MAG: hypothetical protein IKO07_02775 [Clostridia bacterium]|nr:hypothetical protein [Clostridia bacterium]
MELNETIRRLVMAGIGAVSYTFEKSKDLADTLVKKGEETAAENNVSYEQVRDQLVEQLKNLSEKVRADMSQASFEELLERADDLTDEQREILMDRLLHPLKEEAPCEDKESGEADEEPAEEATEACAPDEAQDEPAEAPAEQESADKAE